MKLLKRSVPNKQIGLKIVISLILSFMFNSTYSQDIPILKSNLNQLKYDSVKVFSFNCSSKVNIEQYGLIADTSLITSSQQWAYTIEGKGNIVNNNDIKYLFKVLIANEFMKKDGDPAGCYKPRLGFAFFKKGIVVAHIDVCLECFKSEMEIFKPNKPAFRYFFKTLRYITETKLSALCSKYNMECCKL
jgi:hypothetical protein